MTARTKRSPGSAAPLTAWSVPARTAPLTTEDQLEQIRALGKRFEEHIRFMSAVAHLPGVSAEAKARAVAQFYQRLAAVESELAQVATDLQLE
jgi:hypothetical protein